MNFVDIVFVWF